jgi:hypothetical protein
MQAREEGLADRARDDLQRARIILSQLATDWRPQADLTSVGERLGAIDAVIGAE